MNKVTQDIAQWLQISVEQAAAVQSEMAVYWAVDFSEATTEELKETAKLAYAEMRLHAAV